ncbi:hypothetical protein FACS189475_10190 [Betaproteobacteria bacterium]|nr:hypothetical protein FACS189475_10190 [Betaproteobacteria bacterium]
MRTDLLQMDGVPDERELRSLLGDDRYEWHRVLCEAIVSRLSPELEIWALAGRRGKYFHGYRNGKSVDIYLLSIDGQGCLKCEFRLNKRMFTRILRQKDSFCEQTRKSIDGTIKIKELGGAYTLELFIDQGALQDAFQILEILARYQ